MSNIKCYMSLVRSRKGYILIDFQSENERCEETGNEPRRKADPEVLAKRKIVRGRRLGLNY